MKHIFYILFSISMLHSLSIQDIQNLGNMEELNSKLNNIKSESISKTINQKPHQKEIVVENIIEEKAIGAFSTVVVQPESERMRKSIFQYQDDDSIIKKRDNFYMPEVDRNISRYGDSFFKNKNSIDSASMAIPSNYKINKGDIVSVWLYGGKNRNDKLEVDRNGNINIERVGPLYVYNLDFKTLKNILVKRYKSLYQNIKINIDLDRTTPIQITIAGEVNSAGIYNVSAFSTIKDALILSNGISPFGSYRNIKLIRKGRVIKTFDVYKFIENGDNSYLNYILNSGDGVIVSRAKKTITITGEIVKSGIYELNKGEKLKELIKFAGGLKFEASNSLAKLERVDNHKKRVVLDIDISENIKLKSGDKISVFQVNYKNSDSIFIYGNIVRSGERGFYEGLTLYNFFEKEVSLNGVDNVFMKNMEMEYSVIKRHNLITFSEEIIQFKLSDILSGKKDIKLLKGDEIYIFNKAELKENPYIHINGIVITNAGKYQYFHNMRLGDIEKFTKFKSETFKNGKRAILKVSRKVKVLRNVREKIEIHFLDLDKDKKFLIEEFDEITFFDELERDTPKLASINGEVLSGGTFRLDNSTDINKLIQLAKGLKKEAFLDKFEVVRYKVVNGEREYRIIRESLKKAMNENFKIEEFDEVTIFKIPRWSEKESVLLSGEIKFPGNYIIQKGDTLSKLVDRAGGYLDTAFFDGAIFTRTSIKQLQEQRLKDSIRKLKKDSLYLISTPASMGENNKDKGMLMKMIDSLVLELAEFKPNGRVSIDLNNETDFILENGDIIHIPTVNETVTVIGEVLNPNSFFFKNGYSIESYLEKSGGLNQKADVDNIYIVHPNGEAERYEQSYLFGFNSTIRTGDTIIIPMKIETSSYATIAKDISQILYQFAITAISLKTVGVF